MFQIYRLLFVNICINGWWIFLVKSEIEWFVTNLTPSKWY